MESSRQALVAHALTNVLVFQHLYKLLFLSGQRSEKLYISPPELQADFLLYPAGQSGTISCIPPKKTGDFLRKFPFFRPCVRENPVL
jgi:hypothetical protein